MLPSIWHPGQSTFHGQAVFVCVILHAYQPALALISACMYIIYSIYMFVCVFLHLPVCTLYIPYICLSVCFCTSKISLFLLRFPHVCTLYIRYICVGLCMHAYVHECAYIWWSIYMSLHTYGDLYRCVSGFLSAYSCYDAYIHTMHIYIHTYTDIYIRTQTY